MKIITISREFGSGGRELGKRLAEALGFSYYDREIISAIAEEVGLSEDFVAHTLEKNVSSGGFPLTFSRTLSLNHLGEVSAPMLLAKQHKVIRELAQKGDCVVVGRSADVVLEDFRPLRIFVHGDMAAKVARCQSRAGKDESLTDREMERKIRQIDKNRAKNHSMVSRYPWGDKAGYDLCINTSDTAIKDIIPALADFAKVWF